jgi:competence protein ComEC
LWIALLLLCSLMAVIYIRTYSSFSPPFLFVVISVFVFILLGMINMERIKPINNKHHYSKVYRKGSTLSIAIQEALKHSQFYHRYIGKIQNVAQHKTEGSIMLRVSKKIHPEPLNYDQLIITIESLTEIKPSLNPGAFDFKAYAKRKNIIHQLDLKTNNFFSKKTEEKTLKIRALQLREKLIQSLARHDFSSDEFSVITAILLGKRQEISKEIVDDYKNAGAMHILAISGLHIGILLILLNFVFKPLTFFRHGKIIRMVVLLICLWSFAFLTGLSASVIRAVSMFTAVTLGLFSNRRSNISNYLFLSIFILLCAHPLYLFDLGFQLSYVSVLSIIWLSPLLKRFWRPKYKVASYFWNLLVISLSAQIGILPLSLFYFHQFSGLFFASSLVVIPFLGIILGFGFLVLALDQLAIVPMFFINAYDTIIRFMNDLMGFLSSHKNFVFENIYFPSVFILLAYGLIFSLERYLKKATSRNFMYILIGIVLLQTALLFEKRKTQLSSSFIVTHQTMQSTIIERKRDVLKASSSLNSTDPKLTRLISPYQQSYFPVKTIIDSAFQNLFRAGEKRVLVVDNAVIFQQLNFNPEILILRNSPKVNLDRFLNLFHPEIVISDGTNFSTYAKRWRTTCKKHRIHIHDTSINGAFVYTYSP